MKRVSAVLVFIACLCIIFTLTAQTRFGVNFFNQSGCPTSGVAVGDVCYDTATNLLRVATAIGPVVWSSFPRLDLGNIWSTGAQDMGSATSYKLPTGAGGVGTADGHIGHDSTKGVPVSYSGLTATKNPLPRILSVSHPAETLSNTTTNDQDWTSIYTIPANLLIAQKIIRVTPCYQLTTDSAASSQAYYLKLGSTKIVTIPVVTPSNSVTRGFCINFLIYGTAAPGASVNVDSFVMNAGAVQSATINTTTQPVALATNGTLTIVPGIAFGTNTSGESVVLLDALVEELN